MRLSRLCVTALLGLTVSGTSVLAEQNAWAANDGIPATLNGAFDGTYEIIFFGNMIGGLSYVYYDTATHVGWTQGTMADPASCGFYPSCYGFLVGSPVTAWYNPNGSGIHVAYLYNVPGTEHGQTWATLSEFEGGPLDWNYSDTGGDDGDLSADGAIPAAQVARGQINGQNALFLSSTTSLTNLFHDNTGQNSENIFYTGTDGKLHTQYNNGSGWGDYTFSGNAPYDTSDGYNLTAVWDGQVDHIYYYGYNSSNEYGLNELYYNNGWYQGSPPATMSPGWLSSAPGSLTGVSYVFGASSSSGMQWDENYAGWHSSNISGTGCNGASTTASYLAGGTTYSFCASGGHIWLVIGNSEVYEMNLTVAAEQSDNSFPSNSPMWGFSTGGACWLYYIDTDSAIHELYSGDCAGSSSWDNYQITNTGVVAN